MRPFAVEGTQRGHWVLMDFSDVIVHIFYEPMREFYDLDGLWGHAPQAKLPASYANLIAQFRRASECCQLSESPSSHVRLISPVQLRKEYS